MNTIDSVSFDKKHEDTSVKTPVGTLHAKKAAAKQLEEYFAGKRTAFQCQLAPTGTPFQQAVWQEVAAIPYGETRTYQEVADAIGRPRAVRAVANAIGKNPIAIIIPCHRVIRSNGELGGFAWGVDKKRWLLEYEKKCS